MSLFSVFAFSNSILKQNQLRDGFDLRYRHLMKKNLLRISVRSLSFWTRNHSPWTMLSCLNSFGTPVVVWTSFFVLTSFPCHPRHQKRMRRMMKMNYFFSLMKMVYLYLHDPGVQVQFFA